MTLANILTGENQNSERSRMRQTIIY